MYLFAHLQAQYGAKSLVQVIHPWEFFARTFGHILRTYDMCMHEPRLKLHHATCRNMQPALWQQPGFLQARMCGAILLANLSPRWEARSCCSQQLISMFKALHLHYWRRSCKFTLALAERCIFAQQEWDTPALAVYLEAAERISASPGSMNVVCCEFPENHVPSRGLPPWICTWKVRGLILP